MVGVLRVALVFAGLFRGNKVSTLELNRAIVRPLKRAGFEVHAFLAGFASEKDSWIEWYNSSTVYTWTELPTDDEFLTSKPYEQSYFSTCTGSGYHLQYGHLALSWESVVRSGIEFSHAIKMRNDLIFHPSQTLQPCWLLELPNATVLVNDVELNAVDRWNERGPTGPALDQGNADPRLKNLVSVSTFPHMQSDQFMMGTKWTMHYLFSMDSTPPRRADACDELVKPWAGNIEHVLADYLFRGGVYTYTPSFQVRRNTNLGALLQTLQACCHLITLLPDTGWPEWINTPCRMCYDCAHHHHEFRSFV